MAPGGLASDPKIDMRLSLGARAGIRYDFAFQFDRLWQSRSRSGRKRVFIPRPVSCRRFIRIVGPKTVRFVRDDRHPAVPSFDCLAGDKVKLLRTTAGMRTEGVPVPFHRPSTDGSIVSVNPSISVPFGTIRKATFPFDLQRMRFTPESHNKLIHRKAIQRWTRVENRLSVPGFARPKRRQMAEIHRFGGLRPAPKNYPPCLASSFRRRALRWMKPAASFWS